MLRALRVRTWPCALALCACASSGGDSTEPAESVTDAGDPSALGSIMSQSGALQLAIHTGPDQPPTRGLSTVDLMITDADSGEPSDDLTLNVVPWMPAMGHGTSVQPSIEAQGGGHYVVDRVNMYMGGVWDLRIAISGTKTDRATLRFTIR